jgi:hypothetical protein
MRAPLALFVFNRPHHTQQTLLSLANNRGAENYMLTIYSDGARTPMDKKKVNEVREICRDACGFASVEMVERENNWGLANNIINGVGQLMEKHGKAIVLEDDLLTSEGFLEYMEEALDFYQHKPVFSICGYCPPIAIPQTYTYTTYLAMRNGSWGWATWKDRWDRVNWELADFDAFFSSRKNRKAFSAAGNDLPMMLLKQKMNIINSWSIRFCYASYKVMQPTVYPTGSLVRNIGIDGSGTHMKQTSKYESTIINDHYNSKLCPSNEINTLIQKEFKRFYNTSAFRWLINEIKTVVYLIGKTI